ncbi:PatB family C-S lyase [Sulfurovum sp. XTW-4]|uniref:cysteine-S-conjugate beta-lyase n=1 Tax=Sulfurovum xiamenensis TaxID=3019066 RepID=A0ABT7QS64_9BACT|nr:PatB family C-S lyase [Sulfurovum xiamenensis]MDM5263918.1 PatB family C-S lyase [Sulfurovum xiamenensis]
MFEAISRQGTHSMKWDEAKKKFGREDLLPLWVADMDLASPACVQGAMLRRASHPMYGYTIYPDAYYESIQNWMRDRFSWEIEREWIIPCYGVVPSLNFIITAYSQKGDGILIQTPIYPPFVSSVKHQKRRVLDNRLVYENGRYQIDFEDFERKAKEAKLFLLCSPHNPTGRVWSEEELEKLIEICIANDVLIISDEIHADIVYEKTHHSIGSFEKIMHHCVVLNAPSKTFNIAGLNTSYAIIPDTRLRQAYRVEQDRSGITNGNPFGIEALMSAYKEGAPWLEELKEHLRSNINYVNQFLTEHQLPIKAVPTEATFLMWLDCRGLGLSHDQVVDFFLHKAKLGLNDGKSFGEAGEGFMRLNVGTSKEVLQEAMQRLRDAYEAG